MPCYPVISPQQQHVVYFTVINYDYNLKWELMEATELYILGIDKNLLGVVSSFKAPSEADGGIPAPRIFTSDFTGYLDKVLPNMLLLFFLTDKCNQFELV